MSEYHPSEAFPHLRDRGPDLELDVGTPVLQPGESFRAGVLRSLKLHRPGLSEEELEKALAGHGF